MDVRQRRWWTLGSVAVVSALLISACSSGSTNSNEGTPAASSAAVTSSAPASSPTAAASEAAATAEAEADARLAAALPKLEWFDPGPAFENAKDLSGKTIYLISVQLNTPFSLSLLKGLEDGAALVGAKVVATDSGGSPPEASRQMAQAISQGAAAIVLQVPSAALAADVQAAKAANIPVFEVFDDAPDGLPTETQAGLGVVANADICWDCEGRLMADAAVSKNGDQTSSLFISTEELVSAVKQEKAYNAELADLCPTCTTSTTMVPIAQWSTGLQAAAASGLSKEGINTLAPVYDLMIPAVQAAAAAAQKNDAITIVSGDATEIGVNAVNDDPSVPMVVGAPTEWVGWLVMDQYLRYENGLPPAADAVLPVRVITKQTITDENFDLSPEANQTAWFTSVDLKSEFSTLWGMAG